MKIAVIGGGSTYTPELIDGFLQRARALGVRRIVLQDINPRRLNILAEFSSRMAARAGRPFEIHSTADTGEALDGADFVITQFRVGGQEARHRDIQLGLRHGLIGQETVGIGGFAKALRTIPPMLALCAQMEKIAPRAWLINFTNPSGLMTEMILTRTGVRAIGLCNVPMELKMIVAGALGVPSEAVRFDYVGLNHLGWVRRVFIHGSDVTGLILDFLTAAKMARPGAGASAMEKEIWRIRKMKGPANIPDVDYDPLLIRSLGMIPQFYLRYYYYPGKMYRAIRGEKKDRAQVVMGIEKDLLNYYRNRTHDAKPALLEERGGAYYSTAAVELISAIAADSGAEHIVNVSNGAATPDLPADAVMEIPCLVGRDGATPRVVGPIEPQIAGLIRQVKAYEQLTIRAAVDRDYRAALTAIMTNPLGPTAENAKKVLDEVIRVNRLPLRSPL